MEERFLFDYYHPDLETDENLAGCDEGWKAFYMKRREVYDWLYKHNKLVENFCDYNVGPTNGTLYFVMPASVVEKYQSEMLNDNVDAEVIDLALNKLNLCEFCGTISLMSIGFSYREEYGLVSKYHSCRLCNGFAVSTLRDLQNKKLEPLEFAKAELEIVRKRWERENTDTRKEQG